MFSKIKGLFKWIGNFIKKHPVASVVILLAVVVVATFATYEAMHLTSNPKFCKLCHDKDGTGPLAEYATWSKNVHAYNEVECLDCHSIQPGAVGYVRAKVEDGLYDLVMEFITSKEHKLEKLSEYPGNPEASAKLVRASICMHCHTDEVNRDNRDKHFMTFAGVAMRKLDTVKNPEFREIYGMADLLEEPVSSGVEPNHAIHINLEVPCAKCHDSAAHSGDFIAKPSMQTCWTCHDEMRAGGANPAENDDCMKCHVNQAGIQEGTVAQKYGVEGERWVMMDLGCESCHPDPFVRPTKESCIDCHDEGYADIMVSFQEAYDEMRADASAFYMGNLEKRSGMTPEKRAIFNEYEKLFDLVDRDGSRSIHNPDYVTNIFGRMDELKAEFEK